MKSVFKRGVLLAILVAVSAVGLTGLAVASIPDSNGVIHGCIRNNQNLRIIDSATQACAGGQIPLNFNQAKKSTVYSGRINDLEPTTFGSLLTGKVGGRSQADLLSSPDPTVLAKFTVKLVTDTTTQGAPSIPFAPGPGGVVNFYVLVDGTQHLLCTIANTENSCTVNASVAILANSLVALKVTRTLPVQVNGINALFYAVVE